MGIESLKDISSILGVSVIAVFGYLCGIFVDFFSDESVIERILQTKEERFKKRQYGVYVITIIFGIANLVIIMDNKVFSILLTPLIQQISQIIILIVLIVVTVVSVVLFKKINWKIKIYILLIWEMAFVEVISIQMNAADINILMIIICFISAFIFSLLGLSSIGFFSYGPSKVSFKDDDGNLAYVYYRWDENSLLCGDSSDIRKAKKTWLLPLSKITYSGEQSGFMKLDIDRGTQNSKVPDDKKPELDNSENGASHKAAAGEKRPKKRGNNRKGKR